MYQDSYIANDAFFCHAAHAKVEQESAHQPDDYIDLPSTFDEHTNDENHSREHEENDADISRDMYDRPSSDNGSTHQGIVRIDFAEEAKKSYLDYAMSVIVSRALPDVRDGLKPVHRRILYAMMEGGYTSAKPAKKSIHIVGDVLGKYHPHSAEAVYDTLVRMAQDFSMRLMLIDGQGNFGSVDGDKAAASRYTEARLQKAAHYLVEDYDRDTVDFCPNYDNSRMMPTVLPARFPNVLVNGSGGIAVGMATNIPTHNLREVIRLCQALLDEPNLTIAEMMEIMPGPDFPTGGIIMGRKGIRDAYTTGKGSIMVRAKTHNETIDKRQAIIVDEIPFQVNKAKMVEQIADLVHQKALEGISDLRDESDRDGMRVVIELKRDASYDVVLNRLFQLTTMQVSFGVNMVALDRGLPKQMNLPHILKAFLRFREEVVVRRTRFFLKKARERSHTLFGLLLAVLNIDEVVRIVRQSKDSAEAKHTLMHTAWTVQQHLEPILLALGEDQNTRPALLDIQQQDKQKSANTPNGRLYYLSAEQAQGILELRLHRLTALEHHKLTTDLEGLIENIEEYLSLLRSRTKILALMKEEFEEIITLFGDDRRTNIEDTYAGYKEEDLIKEETMVVTFSVNSYIKRVPLDIYSAQKRGGKGRAAMSTHDEDVVSKVFVASTHDVILFFSSLGTAYGLKVYQLPLASPQSKGSPLVRCLPFETNESLSTLLPLSKDILAQADNVCILFVTSKGHIRKNALSDFTNLRSSGKMAMKFEEPSERLVAVQIIHDHEDVLLITKKGRSIRFSSQEIRRFAGRTSMGVRGIKLQKNDEVVAMSVLKSTNASIIERDMYLKKARHKEDSMMNATDSTQTTTESHNALIETEALDLDIDDQHINKIGTTRLAELAGQEEHILTVSSKGYGKRTSAYAYRPTSRGGQGVIAMEVTSRNGDLLAAFAVNPNQDVLILTDQGRLIRINSQDIRITGRAAQGVMLCRLNPQEHIASVVPAASDILDDEEKLALQTDLQNP